MSSLHLKVEQTIERYQLLEGTEGVVVGVSGGPDSTALLDLLVRVIPKSPLCIAHFNHRLREQAGEEADFVQGLAERYGLPFHTRGEDVRRYGERLGLSLEEASRTLRYRYLESIRQNAGAGKIAVGHTMDDQAETLLLKLLRGAGVEGLAAISPQPSGRLIRPLLEVSRAEILQYLDARGLAYLCDPSNHELYYMRNRIRHGLIPLLEDEYNPNIRETLARTTRIIQAENALLTELAEEALRRVAEVKAGEVRFSLEEFCTLSPALQRRVLRLAVRKMRGNLRNLALTHIDAIARLSGQDVGTTISLPNGISATRDYRLLMLRDVPHLRTAPNVPADLSLPGATTLPHLGLRIHAEVFPRSEVKSLEGKRLEAFLDRDRLRGSLRLRSRQPGDRFHPFGAPGEKKLHDFFVDEKVPRRERDRVLLCTTGERIVWVVGHRIDERAKVTDQTRSVAYLRAEPA